MKIRKSAFFQKPFVKKPLLYLYNLYQDFVAHIICDDKVYLNYIYKKRFKRELNLSNPQSFNEKLNWLKLYDRNPLYSRLADKYQVKQYVTDLIGSEHVVPCYGKWDNVHSIDLKSLPNKFVLKATGDSSGAILCKDLSSFDLIAAKRKLSKSLKTNYFYRTREWPYKDIKPVVIADQLLDDHSGTELQDYKFWCFNGVPKVMYITNKGKHIYENFYDMDFNPVEINHGFPRKKPEYKCPDSFEIMKQLAVQLSKDIPFVRVDFFYVDGRVYFGEYTFYDWAGLRPFVNFNDDINLGKLISLPILQNINEK